MSRIKRNKSLFEAKTKEDLISVLSYSKRPRKRFNRESKLRYSFREADKVDTKEVIKSLQDSFSKDNESQMKGVQLLKGLATSEDELANKFMKELDTATTEISKKLLKGSKE